MSRTSRDGSNTRFATLEHRDEPRDLLDLWWALARAIVRFADIAVAHRAAFGYPPMPVSIERARRLEVGWRQRLGHQLRDLPSFNDAIEEIRRHFETWRSPEGKSL
jgi:hypothetical protein